MCGIAGIVGRWPGLDLGRFRDRAYELLALRGPDDRGAVFLRSGRIQPAKTGEIPESAEVLLVHTRLAIVDLTPAGAQPMVAREGGAALAFNGEIYNSEELRHRMGLSEGDLRGRSDTEILLHWLRRGGALNALAGMFAVAFLDTDGGRLLLARDGYGIKPLFLVARPGRVAFASDLRILLELPGLSRLVNRSAAEAFLCWGTLPAARRTMFEEILTLDPGESVSIPLRDPSSVEWKQWYRPSPAVTYTQPFSTAVREVRETFLESIRLHLKSDVRLGCTLSGGIDSSSIVMAARRLLGSGAELHTLSHVAADPLKSEERWIDLVNEASGAIPHKVRPVPEELAEEMDDLICAQGEPFVSTSMYAQYRVFKEAKRIGVTVLLDGQGADELLAGYPGYAASYVRELGRRGRFDLVAGLLLNSGVRRNIGLRRVLAKRWNLIWARLFGARRDVSVPVGAPWMTPASGSDIGSQPSVIGNPGGVPRLKAHLAASVHLELRHLLRYEDRNSMCHSIESRVPFLWNRLADLILSLPSGYLIGPGGRSKEVFRAAMRGIVPDAILDRRDKVGFENNEAAWLLAAAPWVEDVLAGSEGQSRVLDTSRLRTAWDGFQQGGKEREFAGALWRGLIYLRWLGLFEGRER